MRDKPTLKEAKKSRKMHFAPEIYKKSREDKKEKERGSQEGRKNMSEQKIAF